jgi:hypothetical protein
MTASFVPVCAVLCIWISLFSSFFYSIPFINRLVRIKENQFLNVRVLLVTLLLYVFIFVVVESIFLYLEGYSLCALSWPVKTLFFSSVTLLILAAIRFVSGDLLISAPQFYVEKIIRLEGSFEDDSAFFLELFVDCKGEVILEALDKKIIIARLPLTLGEGLNSQQEVMIEFTFSESFLKSALVQIVCYPASRGVFIEKTTMSLLLDNLEARYREKILFQKRK